MVNPVYRTPDKITGRSSALSPDTGQNHRTLFGLVTRHRTGIIERSSALLPDTGHGSPDVALPRHRTPDKVLTPDTGHGDLPDQLTGHEVKPLYCPSGHCTSSTGRPSSTGHRTMFTRLCPEIPYLLGTLWCSCLKLILVLTGHHLLVLNDDYSTRSNDGYIPSSDVEFGPQLPSNQNS